MDTNYTHLRRLAAARAVVSLFTSMKTEDALAVGSILAGLDASEDMCGISREQRLRLIDITDALDHDVPNPDLAADLTAIITANHGDGPFARAAAGIDLLKTLREIEHLVRVNEAMTADILHSKSHKDHFAAANAAIFRLREIGRIVNPVVALLQPGASDDAARIAAE